jgi:uncharacterized repeat protein (TIGR03803 family)
MRKISLPATAGQIFGLILFVISVATFSPAQTITAAQEIAWIYNTYSGLVMDSSGNLYGTYDTGGDFTNCPNAGCGQVYELSPNSDGTYTQTILYNFAGGTDGSSPFGLAIDSAGNLYGSTAYGGSLSCYVIGCGTVYKLSPSGSSWTETILYRFNDTSRGVFSGSPLVLDSHGNLYGTTGGGGDPATCNGSGCGVVFKLSNGSNGKWNESVLYRFQGGASGFAPTGALTLDSRGHIFGALQAGGNFSAACGPNGCGVIFELVNTAHGWREGVVHTFNGNDGSEPNGSLALDAAGNLYGSTRSGGPRLYGTAFQLSHTGGAWKESALHVFTGGLDGDTPTSGLVLDHAGNLFGTTAFSNSAGCGDSSCGQVFELSRSSGTWRIGAIYTIPLGYYPSGGLLIDSAGNLFGTALDNHYFSGGVAYEVTQ